MSLSVISSGFKQGKSHSFDLDTMDYNVDDKLASDQDKQATETNHITMLCSSEQHKLSYK